MASRAANLPTFRFQTVGFRGGANIRDAINFMAPDQMRPSENVVLDEHGGGRKRLGCESYGTYGAAADRCLGLYTFYRGPGVAPQVVMCTSAGQLLYTNNPSVNPPTWQVMASGLSTTARMAFETYNNKLYMSNGVDPYASWDGSAYTPYPSAPKGRYLRLWKETMWVAGVPFLPDRLYSSNPGDAETFPVDGYVDIGDGDGDEITALMTDGNFLVVGKRDSTHLVYDPVFFDNRVVDVEKGFESHHAVCQFDGQTYFLSRRGICRYVGDAPSVVISERIDPLFHPDLIQLDQMGLSHSYAYESRIGFAMPEKGSGGKNTIVIEYYPRIAITQFGSQGVAPFVFHRMPVQDYVSWRWQDKDMLFGCHNNSNKFLRVFGPVGTDDGVAYAAVMQTPVFDMGDPIMTKYLREFRFLCSGRFNVLVYRNYGNDIYGTFPIDATREFDLWDAAIDHWGAGEWGVDPLTRDFRQNVDLFGRCFSFRFVDSDEPGTNNVLIWVGADGKEIITGEWAVYGMFAEGTMLGKRT
jgi:hypothetical protein